MGTSTRDTRGLEVRGHGGGSCSVVAVLPCYNDRYRGNPYGCSSHFRVRGSGQDYRHLPREVRPDCGHAAVTTWRSFTIIHSVLTQWMRGSLSLNQADSSFNIVK